ncbi:type II toxin-antitoxin system VapB family antitoxin [Thermococcus barophilus]|uniref:VapB-type antitoxin n=1 Tax=Thermococcus barophilus TaxID=55802 RepID=A0A0S1XDI9_THEBA|nr:hypothetical protein [Thermococcus barophilus]ALM75850.1 hypothetical protein TBCH5v1_1946 [Thermococcus barophilus]
MAIITVRVPDELKLKMKQLNINWSEEIREFIRRRIDEEERRRKLKKALEILRQSRGSVEMGFSAKVVREDRDSH